MRESQIEAAGKKTNFFAPQNTDRGLRQPVVFFTLHQGPRNTEQSMTLDYEQLYFTAYEMRTFEHEVARAFDAGEVPGLVHLSLGAELLHALLGVVLKRDCDKILGSHRSHTLALAGGADPEAVAAEILGRVGGLSGGVAGTQHLMDQASAFLTSTGIVASQVSLAAGAALSALTLKTGGLAVAVMGDGAVNQGAFYEAANLASMLSLPLLILVENNGLAQHTDAEAVTAGTVLGRARALGLATAQVQLDDLSAVHEQLVRLAGWARSGGGPALLEVLLTRESGHVHGADAGPVQTEGSALEALRRRLDIPDLEHREADIKARMAQMFDAVLAQPRAGEGADDAC